MAAATTTFTEISGAFSEIQALQRILYADFTHAVRDKSDGSDQALVTRNAQAVSEMVERLIKVKGYGTGQDSKAAAGMALVDICNTAREHL